MLDLKFIRENPEKVKDALQKKEDMRLILMNFYLLKIKGLAF